MHRDAFWFCTIAAAIVLWSTPGLAHPGGLDKNGGHVDKKTGEYHYHKPKGTGTETSDPPVPTAAPKAPAPAPVTTPPIPAPTPVPSAPVVPPPRVTSGQAASAVIATNQVTDYAQVIARLIDPAQLARLETHGADARAYQVTALLEQSSLQGQSVPEVATNAVRLAGYTNVLWAAVTCDALTRNHQAAREFGVLAATGLGQMQRGQPPTVANGSFGGDTLSVAHTIPLALVPELDNVLANLELLPSKVKSAKGDQIGLRQYELARKFHAAGLLTADQTNELLAK